MNTPNTDTNESHQPASDGCMARLVRQCDDGYPSCRQAEQTGFFCENQCAVHALCVSQSPDALWCYMAANHDVHLTETEIGDIYAAAYPNYDKMRIENFNLRQSLESLMRVAWPIDDDDVDRYHCVMARCRQVIKTNEKSAATGSQGNDHE